MKITMVISDLYAGGAQRVMSRMANYWARRGVETSILTLTDGSVGPFYALEPGIHYVPLGIAAGSPNILAAVWNNMKRIRALRESICGTNPDVVVSFMDQVNVLTLLATTGTHLRVVVSERIDPSRYRIGITWELLRRLVLII